MIKYIPLMLLAANAYAAETCKVETQSGNFDVPCVLVDGEIQVTLKSGEVYNFSANEWKVVSRKSGVLNKENIEALNAELVAARMANKKNGEKIEELAERAEALSVREHKNHRVTAYLGAGPTGMDVKFNQNNTIDIKQKTGVIGAVGYGYKFDDSNWSINGLLVSPKEVDKDKVTTAIGAGYDF